MAKRRFRDEGLLFGDYAWPSLRKESAPSSTSNPMVRSRSRGSE